MTGQAEICESVADALREAFKAWADVTVELEDSCAPAVVIRKAQGKRGVLVLVATTSHTRRTGCGALTDGALSLELVVVENPKLNRIKGANVPTVTTVAEAARDALHWRDVGGMFLTYDDMQRADVADDDYRMEVHFTVQPGTQGASAPEADGTPEPEEIVEGAVVGALAEAMPGWAVVGALAAAETGIELPDTRIDVTVDVASQMMDWEEARGVPRKYSVGVALRVADADDRTGTLLRRAARAVRAALAALTGDGCAALDGDGFSCNAFVVDRTRTVRDQGADASGKTKTYNATVTGRYIPETTEQEET